MSNDARPVIAITMGDPAGIGPEIAAKAMLHAEVFRDARPIVIGDAGVLRQAIEIVQAPLRINIITSCDQATGTPGIMDVLNVGTVPFDHFKFGEVSAASGNAAFQYILTAIDLAMKNEIGAVVTCPINKEALHLAGHKFPGHTEIFAKYSGSRDSVMMLAEGHFRVAHVSTHVALKEAVARCTTERVLRVIELAAQACRDLGIPNPHVGVAGLNPHAGENGLFGDEEAKAIIPAIEAAKSRGIRASGPYPADTFFPRAAGGKGEFDICIAMYHDQGHVAVKMRGFNFDAAKGKWNAVNGINVSLGLPIIRVSVDHGTAFDIAGKAIASEASLLDAIAYGGKMARQRLQGGSGVPPLFHTGAANPNPSGT